MDRADRRIPNQPTPHDSERCEQDDQGWLDQSLGLLNLYKGRHQPITLSSFPFPQSFLHSIMFNRFLSINFGLAITLLVMAALVGCSPLSRDSGEAPYGGRGSLRIGSTAPPIAISNWFQGEAIEELQVGQVYVIEFWATWCGPCLLNMPHMSELQDQYEEQVIFIGVTDEGPGKVSAFLASESLSGKPWTEEITYRLGTDSEEQMYRTYMAAADQMGIPTAFIVGKSGKIEWIGHPADIDSPLATAVKITN